MEAAFLLVLAMTAACATAVSLDGEFVVTTSGATVWVPAGAPYPRNMVVPSEPVRQDPVAQGGEFVETTAGTVVWVPLGAPYPWNMVRVKTFAINPDPSNFAPPPSQYREEYTEPEYNAQPQYTPNFADEETAWASSWRRFY